MLKKIGENYLKIYSLFQFRNRHYLITANKKGLAFRAKIRYFSIVNSEPVMQIPKGCPEGTPSEDSHNGLCCL